LKDVLSTDFLRTERITTRLFVAAEVSHCHISRQLKDDKQKNPQNMRRRCIPNDEEKQATRTKHSLRIKLKINAGSSNNLKNVWLRFMAWRTLAKYLHCLLLHYNELNMPITQTPHTVNVSIFLPLRLHST